MEVMSKNQQHSVQYLVMVSEGSVDYSIAAFFQMLCRAYCSL